ncbi:MAG: DUF308 domain-containing protein [Chloroflexi bacterium]|nr:DUF308 domain-containing protein [Chloroflexota bacterium]
MSTSAMSFKTNQSPWWLILIGGVLNIIVGVLLLTSPVKTVFVLVLALGYYWLFTGILGLVAMFLDTTAWGWKLFSSLLSIAAGIIILRYPLINVLIIPVILILFLGIQSLVVGIIGLILALRGGGWGAAIFSGLSIVFGLILIFNYTSPTLILSLVWAAAIFAVVGGISQSIMAFQQRPA